MVLRMENIFTANIIMLKKNVHGTFNKYPTVFAHSVESKICDCYNETTHLFFHSFVQCSKNNIADYGTCHNILVIFQENYEGSVIS